jgi:predicted nucleotidyltransferase
MNSGLSAEDLGELIRVFRTFPSLQSVVLFGSRAKGTFQSGSDVDSGFKR